MKCILMNKNMPVVELELDEDTATILKVGKTYELDFLPVGIDAKTGIPNKKELNEWWFGRSIPVSRSGIRAALERMGVWHSEQLLLRCYGLNLSDQYWMKPVDSELEWKNINFFENEFSDDVGNILFGQPAGQDIDLMSPCNTSDGWLKKMENYFSSYEHFMNACGRLGIPGIKEFMDYMLVFDYLMVNTDRHFGNFGAIRDVEALEWIGPAPVFDSGTSLWHDKLTRAINPSGEVETKPSYSNASRQMELVSDFSWLPFEELRYLKDDIREIFVPTEFIDEERIEVLSNAVISRVGELQGMEMEQKKQYTLGSIDHSKK